MVYPDPTCTVSRSRPPSNSYLDFSTVHTRSEVLRVHSTPLCVYSLPFGDGVTAGLGPLHPGTHTEKQDLSRLPTGPDPQQTLRPKISYPRPDFNVPKFRIKSENGRHPRIRSVNWEIEETFYFNMVEAVSPCHL